MQQLIREHKDAYDQEPLYDALEQMVEDLDFMVRNAYNRSKGRV
jgi:hypothetical protein